MGPRWSRKAPNGLIMSKDYPRVTSGPILGKTVFLKNGKTHGNVQEPQKRFSYGELSEMQVLRAVIRNTGFRVGYQYQNKHALRERRPLAFCFYGK